MDPWHISDIDILIRLSLSMLLGGFIGWERESKNHAAGFRTHILVCVGSTLIMLLSMYGFEAFVYEMNVRMDPARLAAQVISGIGFLGAGVILRDGLTIKGLTTAASVWVIAAIGLAIGAGFYFAAIVSTVVVIISLWILNVLEKKWTKVQRDEHLIITLSHQAHPLEDICGLLAGRHIAITNLAIKDVTQDDRRMKRLELTLKRTKPSREQVLMKAVEQISALEGVLGVELPDGVAAQLRINSDGKTGSLSL